MHYGFNSWALTGSHPKLAWFFLFKNEGSKPPFTLKWPSFLGSDPLWRFYVYILDCSLVILPIMYLNFLVQWHGQLTGYATDKFEFLSFVNA